MTTQDDSNFFSRWSRRKVQVRANEPLPPEPPPPRPTAPVVAVAAPPVATEPVPAEAPAEQPPLPTMEDVARLTPESDYASFVARGVPSDVRNAAVKKLFTDPRYNVMDGLDIYIDDYSKPSPLSAAHMAKMVGAQFLKLVDDPDEPKPENAAPPLPAPPAVEPTVSPDTSDNTASARPEPHDDNADLQLQPDHDPEPGRSGPGTG
ncbi:MAG: DUF3306 domain-containing protein [Hydrogenophaga sp.]|uniref:DUF3306 domain-containing protein n=1 Tax=Hydrogenophaga sp. TaxID=1904254 RepID=UPI0026078C99|nr:DUF3306 domain-containing protein [Hydrogenophaga sp.]MCV0440617.1 DUF3306 domain-containing protein [Hydrogenophaga sp.]